MSDSNTVEGQEMPAPVVTIEREALTFTLADSVHRFELSNALAEGDWQAAIEWATLFKLCEMTELQRQLMAMVATQRADAANAAQSLDIGALVSEALGALKGAMPEGPAVRHTPGGVVTRNRE